MKSDKSISLDGPKSLLFLSRFETKKGRTITIDKNSIFSQGPNIPAIGRADRQLHGEDSSKTMPGILLRLWQACSGEQDGWKPQIRIGDSNQFVFDPIGGLLVVAL